MVIIPIFVFLMGKCEFADEIFRGCRSGKSKG